MQYPYCVMFVAAMLDDLSLDPWPGLSDEELATYLLKERLRGFHGPDIVDASSESFC